MIPKQTASLSGYSKFSMLLYAVNTLMLMFPRHLASHLVICRGSMTVVQKSTGHTRLWTSLWSDSQYVWWLEAVLFSFRLASVCAADGQYDVCGMRAACRSSLSRRWDAGVYHHQQLQQNSSGYPPAAHSMLNTHKVHRLSLTMLYAKSDTHMKMILYQHLWDRAETHHLA